MGFIQLHPFHLQVLDGLLVVFPSPMRSDALEAMYGLDVDATDIGRPFIADPPSLTFEQLEHGRFWQLAARHQGTFPFRKLAPTGRARQALYMVVFPRPRPMTEIVPTGLVEIRTRLIRTGKSTILSLDNWCRSHIRASFPPRKSP